MSNRSKKLEEELQLKLLAITEDPAYRGNRDKGNKYLPGIMIDLDSEQLLETESHGARTIH